MHGAALLSEPGKPLPKDVLRTLSHGLEFVDNFFMELHTDSSTQSRNEMMFSLSSRSSTDTHNVDELLKFSKEINEIGVLLSRDTPDIVAKHEEAIDVCAEQLSADELQVSGTVGPSDVKVVGHNFICYILKNAILLVRARSADSLFYLNHNLYLKNINKIVRLLVFGVFIF